MNPINQKSVACILLAAIGGLFSEPASAQSSWVAETTGTPKTLRGTAFDGQGFVCVADDGVIISSADGMTWSGATSGTSKSLRSVAFSPTQWLASGEDGTVLTSPDGTTWTTQTTPASVANKFLSGVAYGAGKYVSVGGSGSIIESSDAINWIDAASVPPAPFLQGVAYGNGKFVAVGSTGTILYSSDGSTWQAATSGSSRFLYGLTHANGLFVVVGQSGTVLTSPDAITWSTQAAGTAASLRCIVFANSGFIVGGDDGTVITSNDAIVWEPQTSGLTESIFGIAYGAGNFVAAGGKLDTIGPGSTSVIITSPTGIDFGFRWDSNSLDIIETAGSATITVNRIGPSGTAVVAKWSVTGGSATAADDFTDSSANISFAIGESSRQITIPIIDDSLLELPETIELTLETVTPNLTIHGQPIFTVTILDNEDFDSDGLDDTWEIAHFGNITLYDGSDDPDMDNNDNARELLDGTDPDDLASANYYVTAGTRSGSGSVSLSPAKAIYDAGESVMISATPASGYGFGGWSDPGYGLANPITLPPLDSDVSIDADFLLTYAEALDQAALQWFSGSSGFAWETQTTITFDGVDAITADGDTISSGDSILIETLVYGPADLSFYWKVSSAEDSDYLRFFIDGDEAAAISGEVGWVQANFSLAPGPHHLEWGYERGFNAPEGHNTAWIDQVAFSLPYASWLPHHFTAGEISDPLISGAAADPDCDGLSNFFEYAFGSDPRSGSAAAPALPKIVKVELSPGEDRVAILFGRPVTRLGEVIYTVETSQSLLPSSWLPLAGTPEILGENAGIQNIRHLDPAPLDPRNHYRVTVGATP